MKALQAKYELTVQASLLVIEDYVELSDLDISAVLNIMIIDNAAQAKVLE